MKTKTILLALALSASTCLLHAQDGKPAPDGKGPPPAGGPGPGPGGPRLHLLPRGAEEQLNLTADQKKQLGDLEASVKTQLEKILTADQQEKLKEMRPPPPPQGEAGSGKKGAPKDPPPQ